MKQEVRGPRGERQIQTQQLSAVALDNGSRLRQCVLLAAFRWSGSAKRFLGDEAERSLLPLGFAHANALGLPGRPASMWTHRSSKAGVPPTPGLIFGFRWCVHRYSVRSVLGEEVSPFLPQTAPLSTLDICHFQLPLWPDWPRLLKTPSLSHYIQLQTNSFASELYSR